MKPWHYFIYGTVVLIVTTLINLGTADDTGGSSARAWSGGSGSSGWSSGGSHK
ncbi:hypothetical protein [Azoarcus sp. DD4]|uniref:hypothetical protein n=1 Tax=Azoarcus sp. DD4 TaxID=2027405 RepID=UPI00143CF84E|nr:hypothetical protein [Azoarcus sp. DD4]